MANEEHIQVRKKNHARHQLPPHHSMHVGDKSNDKGLHIFCGKGLWTNLTTTSGWRAPALLAMENPSVQSWFGIQSSYTSSVACFFWPSTRLLIFSEMTSIANSTRISNHWTKVVGDQNFGHSPTPEHCCHHFKMIQNAVAKWKRTPQQAKS